MGTKNDSKVTSSILLVSFESLFYHFGGGTLFESLFRYFKIFWVSGLEGRAPHHKLTAILPLDDGQVEIRHFTVVTASGPREG